MEEKDLITIIETSQRCKSNTHRIEELSDRMTGLEKKQEQIYDLTVAVRELAIQMSTVNTSLADVKEGLKEVKGQQDNLDKKIEDVKNRPAKAWADLGMKSLEKIVLIFVGGLGAFLLAKLFEL